MTKEKETNKSASKQIRNEPHIRDKMEIKSDKKKIKKLTKKRKRSKKN